MVRVSISRDDESLYLEKDPSSNIEVEDELWERFVRAEAEWSGVQSILSELFAETIFLG